MENMRYEILTVHSKNPHRVNDALATKINEALSEGCTLVGGLAMVYCSSWDVTFISQGIMRPMVTVDVK